MASELTHKLATAFKQYGYKWMIGGTLTTPTVKDLEKTIDKAVEALYDEPVPSQVSIGRLIIRRWATDKFEVYLHIGDIND